MSGLEGDDYEIVVFVFLKFEVSGISLPVRGGDQSFRGAKSHYAAFNTSLEKERSETVNNRVLYTTDAIENGL